VLNKWQKNIFKTVLLQTEHSPACRWNSVL